MKSNPLAHAGHYPAIRQRRNPFRCLTALLVSAGFALVPAISGAQAVAKPSAETITIESDQMKYDDKARVNVFEGNVVLVRGALEIRAAQLKLSEDANGNQVAIATGRPARFVQRHPDGHTQVKGEGNELRYSNRTEEVIIAGGATLLRSIPGKEPDRVRGARIIYQSKNDFFTVEGGKAAASESNPRGRVQVVIQPKGAGSGQRTAVPLAPARKLADKPAR